MTRPPYKAGRGQETVWKALHQISHSPFSKEIERAHLPGKFSSPNYVMYDGRADPIGHISHYRQSMAFHLGTVWKVLHQISHSPFSKEIERAHLPGKFSSPNYVMYDGRADPIRHISHYRQSMALHLGNDALMCRVFLSSLGPMSFRWFNRLQHSSIHSWDELVEAFVSRFITNCRKPKEFDSLLLMRMKDSESLKSYCSRYWEVYNEVDGCTEEIAIKTFKLGLDPKSEPRHNLSRRPAKSMRDLMSQIEQFVRVEDDRTRTTALSTQGQPLKKPASME
uniref:Retrotransposon gag domain-containing protein n=1 Tax=Fagus sylvatica TaxID=28930 RepID=A0A2N9GII3_FAGSY